MTRLVQPMGRSSQGGFSMVEALVAIFIMMLVMGAIFSQIIEGQRYSTTEQVRTDLFQEAREFVDQLSRDLRSSGYPNTHNYDHNPNSASSPSNEYLSDVEAVGLVRLDPSNLWFEASIDGTGEVYVIRYHLDNTSAGCDGELPCLVRSQTDKVTGDPVTQGESPQTQLQNVKNGTSADPIFMAFDAAGNAVHSIDIGCDGLSATSVTGYTCDPSNIRIANINSVAVKLTVQSPYNDQTGKKPTATLFSTIRLTNCSLAYTAAGNSVMGCN
ncbi:MAG: PilW family protein [Terriglobales bacterium]